MSHFTLLAPICFCLLSFLLTPTTIATPAPVPDPANGDPCGPAIQDNPDYPNTCSVPPTPVNSPAPYGINCTDANLESLHAPVWGACQASLESICTKALDKRTRTGVWIYSSLADGCALGIFLPPYQGSAKLLNRTRCEEIFTAMSNTCQDSVPTSSIGSVNVRTIPGFTGAIAGGVRPGMYSFKGDAVNVGYPSYSISFYPLVNAWSP